MQQILIIDFGGQYTELIARAVRHAGVYSVVKAWDTDIDTIKAINPIGIIFTGGPHSVYLDGAPECDSEVFELGVPILGICYGMQHIADHFGGKVERGVVREYGATKVYQNQSSPLFASLASEEIMLMSHTDYITRVPADFITTAHTKVCPCVAFENTQKHIYGVQFHPEAEISQNGEKLIENFVVGICGATRDYSLDDYIARQTSLIREQVGDKNVLLGLSGGIDSVVVAALISKALPNRLLCVYVDNGFMRKNETDEIIQTMSTLPLKLEVVDAKERFFKKVESVTDPEQKRKIIGEEFVKVFAEIAQNHSGYDYLAQGTIYPDVIESGDKNSATIKTHHNVGGLPENLPFVGLVEPLRDLFKDEVRIIGTKLGLPDDIVSRQPFPGPGLAIRCIGEITKEKLSILQDADYILREEFAKANVDADQFFAVITDTKSVGVIGDYRNYGYVVVLRAVKTSDFMTAEFARVPYDVLAIVSSRIVNEVHGVSRVCYDVTSKPPATIEWE